MCADVDSLLVQNTILGCKSNIRQFLFPPETKTLLLLKMSQVWSWDTSLSVTRCLNIFEVPMSGLRSNTIIPRQDCETDASSKMKSGQDHCRVLRTHFVQTHVMAGK